MADILEKSLREPPESLWQELFGQTFLNVGINKTELGKLRNSKLDGTQSPQVCKFIDHFLLHVNVFDFFLTQVNRLITYESADLRTRSLKHCRRGDSIQPLFRFIIAKFAILQFENDWSCTIAIETAGFNLWF